MDFTKKIVTAIVAVCLTVTSIVGMLTNNAPIAYTAVGGLVGWMAGNKNGDRQAPTTA